MRTRLFHPAAAVILIALAACGSDATDATIHAVPGVPQGWNGGGLSGGWEAGLDTGRPHGGKAAAYIRSAVDAPTGYANFGQSIRADAYRGKRIQLSGWLRSEDVRGSGGALWLRVDGPGTVLALDNMGVRPVRGTSGWQRVSLVVDVPATALGVALGALLAGPGYLLVDDLSLAIVGTDILSTDMLFAPMPAATDSMAMKAWYQAAPSSPANLDFEAAVGG